MRDDRRHGLTTAFQVIRARIHKDPRFMALRATLVERIAVTWAAQASAAAFHAAGGRSTLAEHELSAFLAAHPDVTVDLGSKLIPMTFADVIRQDFAIIQNDARWREGALRAPCPASEVNHG